MPSHRFAPRSAALQTAFAALVAAAGSALAADYYVSPRGSDANAGSSGAPWATLQHGADQLRAGDTLNVMPGTYNEKLYINRSGAPGRPITIKSATKHAAVINGRKVKGDNLIYMEDRSFVRIIGFDLTENTGVRDGSGIRFSGQGGGIEIRDNKIHGIEGKDAMGITIYAHKRRPLDGLIIDGNEIFDCEPAKSEALTLNGNITNFSVTNNIVRDVNNIGIDFIGGEESEAGGVPRSGVCRGNQVYRANSNYGGGYAAGIYVDGARDIVIEGNTVSGCDLGIEIGSENKGIAVTGIVVRKNRIFKNEKAGIAIGGYDEDVGTVTDCTIEGNALSDNGQNRKAQGELWIQWASGNTIRNNTFYGTSGKPLLTAEPGGVGNTLENNTWYSDGGAEFIWGGIELDSFEAYRATSRQGKGSTFKKPN